MSSAVTPPAPRAAPARAGWRKRGDRFGDGAMYAICAGAALLGAIAIVAIAIELVQGAQPAIDKYGLSFLTGSEWKPTPQLSVFGAGSLLYGTLLSSFFALAIGAPVALSI